MRQLESSRNLDLDMKVKFCTAGQILHPSHYFSKNQVKFLGADKGCLRHTGPTLLILLANVPGSGGDEPSQAKHLLMLHDHRRFIRVLGLRDRRRRGGGGGISTGCTRRGPVTGTEENRQKRGLHQDMKSPEVE